MAQSSAVHATEGMDSFPASCQTLLSFNPGREPSYSYLVDGARVRDGSGGGREGIRVSGLSRARSCTSHEYASHKLKSHNLDNYVGEEPDQLIK